MRFLGGTPHMLARWAQLVGVTSLGEGGRTGATYGDSFVFPRVFHVRAWIDDHMKNTQFCKFAGNSDQPINKWNECATKQAEGWKMTWYLISCHPISNTEELDRWPMTDHRFWSRHLQWTHIWTYQIIFSDEIYCVDMMIFITVGRRLMIQSFPSW